MRYRLTGRVAPGGVQVRNPGKARNHDFALIEAVTTGENLFFSSGKSG